MEVFLLFNGAGAFIGITIATLTAIPLAIIWHVAEKASKKAIEPPKPTIDELIREVDASCREDKKQR